MFVCSCFGVTDRQVREHQEAGACTPRQIASVSKAGTDCGSCVRRIQGLLGRGACPGRQPTAAGAAAATGATAAAGAVEDPASAPSVVEAA